MAKTKGETRARRKMSIRKKVNGTARAAPPTQVFRSAKLLLLRPGHRRCGPHHDAGAPSTMDEALKGELTGLKKSDKAKKIGAAIAGALQGQGHRGGRVRPQWLHLSRARPSACRSRLGKPD